MSICHHILQQSIPLHAWACKSMCKRCRLLKVDTESGGMSYLYVVAPCSVISNMSLFYLPSNFHVLFSTGHSTVTETCEYLPQILVRHTIRYLYPWIQILVSTGGCKDTGRASELTGTHGRVPTIFAISIPEFSGGCMCPATLFLSPPHSAPLPRVYTTVWRN